MLPQTEEIRTEDTIGGQTVPLNNVAVGNSRQPSPQYRLFRQNKLRPLKKSFFLEMCNHLSLHRSMHEQTAI